LFRVHNVDEFEYVIALIRRSADVVTVNRRRNELSSPTYLLQGNEYISFSWTPGRARY
jgi:hypothetical protein